MFNESFTRQFADLVQSLIDQRGFSTPIYAAAITADGGIAAVHYISNGMHLNCRVIALELPNRSAALPITYLFVDGPTQQIATARMEANRPPQLN